MKSFGTQMIDCPPLSHPARGAWIEIVALPIAWSLRTVAPRKGCVD